MDESSEFCLSVNHKCEKLLIPPSNQRALDKCLRYGVLIDRNSRQKPIRCIECLNEFGLINGR